MIYLYKKTHRITGLKYLGKTSKTDPYSYLGSGKYWKSHINKHGNNVETEILFESNDSAEIAKMGLYYSNLWNVVDSDEWANLKPESGDGGTFKHTDEAKIKIGEASRKRGNGRLGKTYEEVYSNPELVKEKHRQWMVEHNPFKGKTHSDESRQKMHESAKMRQNLSVDERKEKWGSLKGKPWSDARRAAQQSKRKNKS